MGWRKCVCACAPDAQIYMHQCQTHELKKLRNQMWRSGTEKQHTQRMCHRSKVRLYSPPTHRVCCHCLICLVAAQSQRSNKWTVIEWATLQALFDEDNERFPILNFLSHDHLVWRRVAGMREREKAELAHTEDC